MPPSVQKHQYTRLELLPDSVVDLAICNLTTVNKNANLLGFVSHSYVCDLFTSISTFLQKVLVGSNWLHKILRLSDQTASIWIEIIRINHEDLLECIKRIFLLS